MIWAVYNGYMGNGEVSVLVDANSEKSAFEQAVDAFAANDERPDFSTPGPHWYAHPVEFPYVCELS